MSMMPAARKRFGQHFLNDESVIQHIISTLAPMPGQHLIEIGPGQGALTIPILKQVKQLEVIELDRDLIPQLQERNRSCGELTIYAADALTFDFASLKQDERLLRVFGNLPYNISTPLIFHLLDFAPIIADMLFMLQKEVAVRMSSFPCDKHYGRLSVMVQYYCQVEQLFDVPASAFYPPPKVNSNIVRLLPYHQLPCQAHDFTLFASIVKHAFGQRRKTLRNSLKNIMNADDWEKIDIRPDLRAENLSVNDFVNLANTLSSR